MLAQVEEEGFDCAIPRVDDKDRVIWKCEKTEGDVLYQVLVLGRDEDSVDMIDANFNQKWRGVRRSSRRILVRYCYAAVWRRGASGKLPVDWRDAAHDQ